MKSFFTFQDQLNVKLKISDNLKMLTSDIIGPVFNIIHHLDFQAKRYARIQGYWWKYSKLDGNFHGCVHWRMKTEISVMHATEEVKTLCGLFHMRDQWWSVTKPVNKIRYTFFLYARANRARQYTGKIKKKHSKYLPNQNVRCRVHSTRGPQYHIKLYVFFCIKLDSFLIVSQIPSKKQGNH